MADIPTNWSAYGSFTAALASAALKNLSATAAALSNEIDNSAGDQYADWHLDVRGADVFHAGDYVSCWFLKCVDGTNYEDGSTTGPVTPARPADLIFPTRAVNTQQKIARDCVRFPQGKFKVLLVNTTNHNFTNTDNENVLSYRTYNDNAVTA